MEDIFQAASELGKSIAQSEIYKRYKAASLKLNETPDQLAVMEKFTRLSGSVRDKQLNSIIVDSDEMELLSKTAQKIHDSELLNEYMESQSAFLELMDEVFKQIEMNE